MAKRGREIKRFRFQDHIERRPAQIFEHERKAVADLLEAARLHDAGHGEILQDSMLVPELGGELRIGAILPGDLDHDRRATIVPVAAIQHGVAALVDLLRDRESRRMNHHAHLRGSRHSVRSPRSLQFLQAAPKSTLHVERTR